MTRHPTYVIELSAADRAVLEKRSRSFRARHADVVRAKIVLLCADGLQNSEIAARLDVHASVVRTWRKRFFEAGVDGLADRPRPGRPRSVPPEMPEVGAVDGESTVEGGVPPSQWGSTEPAAPSVSGGVVVPVPEQWAGRARGRRAARRAPAGQLVPFPSRYNPTTSLDALRQLASSINRYLAEIDAEHARDHAEVHAPRGR